MELTIKGEIAGRGMKYREVAEKVGIPPKTFYRKLSNDSFTLPEARKIFKELGMKIVIQG
jgi:predicted DNA-binding transcriptional regulator AlpA